MRVALHPLRAGKCFSPHVTHFIISQKNHFEGRFVSFDLGVTGAFLERDRAMDS
jgi:hypothetical protein